MEEKSSSKDRLLSFLAEKKISKNKCEELCGWSRGYLSILKGDLGSEKLASLTRVFKELNLLWLITGEGEMIAAPQKEIQPSLEQSPPEEKGSVITLSEFMEAIEKYTKIITEKEAEINILRQEVEALKKQIEK